MRKKTGRRERGRVDRALRRIMLAVLVALLAAWFYKALTVKDSWLETVREAAESRAADQALAGRRIWLARRMGALLWRQVPVCRAWKEWSELPGTAAGNSGVPGKPGTEENGGTTHMTAEPDRGTEGSGGLRAYTGVMTADRIAAWLAERMKDWLPLWRFAAEEDIEQPGDSDPDPSYAGYMAGQKEREEAGFLLLYGDESSLVGQWDGTSENGSEGSAGSPWTPGEGAVAGSQSESGSEGGAGEPKTKGEGAATGSRSENRSEGSAGEPKTEGEGAATGSRSENGSKGSSGSPWTPGEDPAAGSGSESMGGTGVNSTETPEDSTGTGSQFPTEGPESGDNAAAQEPAGSSDSRSPENSGASAPEDGSDIQAGLVSSYMEEPAVRALTAGTLAYHIRDGLQVTGKGYILEQLMDYDFLMKNFYSVHSSTTAGREEMDAKTLLGKDLSIEKSDSEPQILIYHTHSQETFADYGPDNREATVVGIGSYLTELLREKGYQVIHDTSQYDIMAGELDRNHAYNYALEGITVILQQNPSIRVVLDVHRDGVSESLHLVSQVNGKPTAQIMFFNGMSQTPDGPIEYLANPYREDNLAFSLQMQLDAAAYYPGLTRKIYLKGLRYNLHVRPRSALIEVGAQTNTYEEALNAMEPLAELLDMVLDG